MDLTNIAMNFGIAAACLVALSLAVWRALIWVGSYVLLPVANRHIKFIDDLTAAMSSQSQAMQNMAMQQGKNLDGIHELTAMAAGMLEKIDRLLTLHDGK